MTRLAAVTLVVAALVLSPVSDRRVAGLEQDKYGGPPPAGGDQASTWSRYCRGDVDDPASSVTPNYDNATVADAAAVLDRVEEHSFALYSDIRRKHVKGAARDSHRFLTYLCGEFRDRGTMVEAKLDWIVAMNYLPMNRNRPFDVGQNPWRQMIAADYAPFLELSASYYEAKSASTGGSRVRLGRHTVDAPVAPMTVCHVKFMLGQYVVRNRSWNGLTRFERDYDRFRQACTRDDLEHLVNFRGDSNFKPNSPESNGMIWFSRSIARGCRDDRVTGRRGLADADCQSYYRWPFESRWNAARSGLAAYVLYARDLEATFDDHPSDHALTVVPDWDYYPEDRPFGFTIGSRQGRYLDGWHEFWRLGGMGLDALSDGQDAEATQGFLYRRLRNAVDRHTVFEDRYSGLTYVADEGGYSPFVASSYEMSVSDPFVTCGHSYTCYDPSVGYYKHWMYVFRVHQDDWYHTVSLDRLSDADRVVPDFDRHWFDETTFGRTENAQIERGWDRLGSALEGELDTILYLHNICGDGSVRGNGNCRREHRATR